MREFMSKNERPGIRGNSPEANPNGCTPRHTILKGPVDPPIDCQT